MNKYKNSAFFSSPSPAPNPSPKSKIQSPEERDWDWGLHYNPTGQHPNSPPPHIAQESSNTQEDAHHFPLLHDAPGLT